MLILNPRSVTFGLATWDGVVAVSIDRAAARVVEEWSDDGPYAVLADVPEQRTRIIVAQEPSADDVGVPRPGDQATLTLHTSPASADAGRRVISATAVVLAVEHEISLKRGASRTITLAAVSASGNADPISIIEAPHSL
ncbi:MAG: hypothetical protein JNM80_12430 [Phycisphaerae bacterium]|nr:hypothetical protein [Phycisphaerae bacterium]